MFDIENYKKVLEFATKAHGDQLTPTGYPYLFHITSVAAEIIVADIHCEDVDLAISCALLHDVIEDTATTYDDVLKSFGVDVANGVLALTKDKSLATKKEQIEDSIDRLLKQPTCIQAVKLADRITNLSSIPEKWNVAKLQKYKAEGEFIYEALKHADSYLARRLKHKILGYSIS
jgi:(p)ppGpp synthase/HD superfamily hydrolase